MKGLNTVLSVLAIIGVVFLFFRNNNTSTQGTEKAEPVESDFHNAKIAFVKPDTIAEYYEYYKELLEEVEGKKKVMESELAERSQSFQNQVMEYQKLAPTLTQAVIQQTEQELGAIQQRLEAYGQQKNNEFLGEQERILKLIREEMDVAVKEVREKLGLDYVLTYDASNFVQSANEDLDISKLVITQLNENHSKKSKGEEKSEE